MNNEFDYKGYVDACKLDKGNVIDIVSDMLHLGWYAKRHNQKFEPDKLIDVLCDAVGTDGTIMIRAFNWDFCKGLPFDLRHTSSQVGSLGNYAMKKGSFRRTKHPLYSWWVWGKYQDELCSLDDNDAFGKNSVFAWQEQNECYTLRIGEPKVEGRTIFHYCEQKCGMPYRYLKFWCGHYIDENGICEKKVFSMNVKSLADSSEVQWELYENIFSALGIVKYRFYDGMKIAVESIPEVTDYIIADMKENFPCLSLTGCYVGFTRNLREEVLNVLKIEFPRIHFENNYRLVSDGILDYDKMVAIADILNKKFDIVIREEDIIEEYFNSYEAITVLVGQTRGQKENIIV